MAANQRDTRENLVDGSRNAPGKGRSRQMKIDSCREVGVGIGRGAHKVLLTNGLGAKIKVEVNATKAECGTHEADLGGQKILNARAEAKVGNAAAEASATSVQEEASAKANAAEAGARAVIVEGVIEANARAGAGLKDLGARAG